jgi:ABC-type transport system involved in multi-copper enzyme maturation permease subunit
MVPPQNDRPITRKRLVIAGVIAALLVVAAASGALGDFAAGFSSGVNAATPAR